MTRTTMRRALVAVTAVVGVLGLAACATGAGEASPIRLGWAGQIPPLDPAASDSVGSYALLSQIYPSLVSVEPGEAVPVPDIAASADWTADGVYTVVLKSGLTFANGDDLTSSDVKFSIERQLALQSEDGAWRQLANLDEVVLVDANTVEFHLGTPVDTGFPFALAGPAGLILDEEAFFADELTSDEDVLTAEPFAGPFTLTAGGGDELVLAPFGSYAGDQPAVSTIELHSGGGESLAGQLQDGSIDAITGRIGAGTLQSLSDDEAIGLTRASSGRARLLAFDLEYMPFGSRTETPDPAKAGAIRVAVSEIVDREALVREVGTSLVQPLLNYIPDGVPGASDLFADLHGDGSGGPDLDRATGALTGAGITTPVELSIHVDLDQVGAPGREEVTALAAQLEDSGLFEVEIVETDAEGLEDARVEGKVQAAFTSFLPANSDPRGYLQPFHSSGIVAPGYGDTNVDALLARQATELDHAVREATLLEAEAAIAAQLPAIPITQGVRVVFARSTIGAIELDDAVPLDLGLLRR